MSGGRYARDVATTDAGPLRPRGTQQCLDAVADDRAGVGDPRSAIRVISSRAIPKSQGSRVR
jgi:hypothetical protein